MRHAFKDNVQELRRILLDRGRSYGAFTNNSKAFSALYDGATKRKAGSLGHTTMTMIAAKMARIRTTKPDAPANPDHYLDIAGYAVLYQAAQETDRGSFIPETALVESILDHMDRRGFSSDLKFKTFADTDRGAARDFNEYMTFMLRGLLDNDYARAIIFAEDLAVGALRALAWATAEQESGDGVAPAAEEQLMFMWGAV